MKKPLQARIIEVLKDNPGLSIKELSSIIGLDMRKLRSIIYGLKSKGYIEKTGKGYIVTNRGERYLSFIEQKTMVSAPRREELAPVQEQVNERKNSQVSYDTAKECTSIPTSGSDHLENTRNEIMSIVNKLKELENRVNILENQLRDLEKAFTITMRRRQEQQLSIDPPVMTYSEALSRYGSNLEKLINEKKALRVGSLIVDKGFYVEFRNKFPLKIADIDKLDSHERMLLEEMRKEALVVLHSGREFRLVD